MAGPFGGGMPNLGKLMKEAQQMQDKMKKVEEDLQELQVEASSGGGMVTATATGAGDILKISISRDVVDPEDIEMLEDLVVTAVREALDKATAIREERLGGVTAGLKGMYIPGLPF